MSEAGRQLLERYFFFYRRLPSDKKEQFIKRADKFISSKRFIPIQMMNVTEEMKTAIAASAVTVMWGYPEVNYDMFRSLVFYPEEYYESRYDSYLQGEVIPEGTIRVSWRDLVFGYAWPKDKINVGLNLMATALSYQNNSPAGASKFLDAESLTKWNQEADTHFGNIRTHGSPYFVDITFLSRNQFFSKSVEHFFEDPEGFRKHYPRLYKALARMLRVDPLNL